MLIESSNQFSALTFLIYCVCIHDTRLCFVPSMCCMIITSAALFAVFILRRELITYSTFVSAGKTNYDAFFLTDSSNLMLCPCSFIEKHFTSLFNKLDSSSLLTIIYISDNERPLPQFGIVLIAFTGCLKISLLNKVGIWYLLIVNFPFVLLPSIYAHILENIRDGFWRNFWRIPPFENWPHIKHHKFAWLIVCLEPDRGIAIDLWE